MLERGSERVLKGANWLFRFIFKGMKCFVIAQHS